MQSTGSLLERSLGSHAESKGLAARVLCCPTDPGRPQAEMKLLWDTRRICYKDRIEGAVPPLQVHQRSQEGVRAMASRHKPANAGETQGARDCLLEPAFRKRRRVGPSCRGCRDFGRRVLLGQVTCLIVGASDPTLSGCLCVEMRTACVFPLSKQLPRLSVGDST